MNEWMIFILVNIILAFVVGVFSNLSSPFIKSFFSKQQLTIRERRIKIIKDEYRGLNKVRAYPEELSFSAFNYLFRGLSQIVILIIAIGLNILVIMSSVKNGETISDLTYLGGGLATFMWGINAYVTFNSYYNYLANIDEKNFGQYQEKTNKRLKKLGTSLEEIEKEIESEEQPNE